MFGGSREEKLRAAIKTRDLMQLRMALWSAETDKGVDSVVVEAAKGVDGAMIQEAKTLLATKPLRTAMARRDVAQLRAAIEVAEGEEDVDGAVVEVSGCGQRTRAIRAMRAIHAWSRCDR